MSNYDFQVEVETNGQTGEVLAVYLQVRRGKSAQVKEFADGAVLVDYDRKGEQLGIEILAPCQVKVLDKIARQAPVKRFLHRAIPRQMARPA